MLRALPSRALLPASIRRQTLQRGSLPPHPHRIALHARWLSSKATSPPANKQSGIFFRDKSAEDILALATPANLGGNVVLAWVHLGKALRRKPKELGQVRSNPQCAYLIEAIKRQVPSLKQAKDMSNVWLGMRDLRVKDAALLETLCRTTADKVDLLDAQAIANILNAMATLHHNPGQEVLEVLCQVAVKKMPSFEAQHIANTLNAMARLDHNPGEEVLAVLCQQAVKKAPFFNAQGIANTLNAMAKLDHNPGEVLVLLCQEAVKKAPSFNAHDIATTLNAMAKLDHNPGTKVLGMLCREAVKKAPSFNAQDIANLLNAVAKFNHNPGDMVLGVLREEVWKKAPSFTAQNIANTLHALAKLNHNPGHDVLSVFVERSLVLAEAFTEQEIANVLYALCILGYVKPAAALFSCLLARLPESAIAMPSQHLSQLYMVHLSLLWEHASSGIAFPAELAEACKADILGSHVQKILRVGNSQFHIKVSEVLRTMLDLPHVHEDASSGLPVDIAWPQHKVAIELDGPSHFLSSWTPEEVPQYLGTTYFKHRLLRAIGWQVVSISWFEWKWNTAGGRADQMAYLRDKLDCAGVLSILGAA